MGIFMHIRRPNSAKDIHFSEENINNVFKRARMTRNVTPTKDRISLFSSSFLRKSEPVINKPFSLQDGLRNAEDAEFVILG